MKPTCAGEFPSRLARRQDGPNQDTAEAAPHQLHIARGVFSAAMWVRQCPTISEDDIFLFACPYQPTHIGGIRIIKNKNPEESTQFQDRHIPALIIVHDVLLNSFTFVTASFACSSSAFALPFLAPMSSLMVHVVSNLLVPSNLFHNYHSASI